MDRNEQNGLVRSQGPSRGSDELELKRLLAFSHRDPHAILGAHPGPDGVVVRAFRPDATGVSVHADDGGAWPMQCIDEAGLFEVRIAERREVFPYRIQVRYPDGVLVDVREPYPFLPSVGGLDLHLLGEGHHEDLYQKLGAHPQQLDGVAGVSFAVWAPSAVGVSVVGDFNGWDGRLHMMRSLGASGIWEIFVPELEPGAIYKYEIRTLQGPIIKTDPFAFALEVPAKTASVVYQAGHRWSDAEWMSRRAAQNPWREAVSIYEVHLGSWRRNPDAPEQVLGYRELGPLLADYVCELGFSHVELLPIQEHPFAGSWGYQVSGYFAPTARHGTPDDFKWLVDYLHRRGIGVIVDWVPAHFPKDAFALARFDGTALYEHLDPRQGEHPDWGTYVFNYGRAEVRNFLLASALYWLSELHIDGLRVDAVASMLYLDYSRRDGEWIPNAFGGRENLEAIAFLKDLNQVVHRRCPGVLMVAEESTAWPGVSRSTEVGGLGFGFKWNMGWMHDTLQYFGRDPIHRRYHHHQLTFGLVYAWAENFILPLSHDEVVHGKGSLLAKMPGDLESKFANLRALYALMWAHPGKKLLFMGGEFGQLREWNHDQSLDWHLLGDSAHLGLQRLVRDLNHLYRETPALHDSDTDPSGFRWIDASAVDQNVFSFQRCSPGGEQRLVCIVNLSAVTRRGYRLGLPGPGWYREVLNTDATVYGGTNCGNSGGVWAEGRPSHGLADSAEFVLPALGCLWFLGERRDGSNASTAGGEG